ncbi:MFS transporter, ACS family, pantothenate transporter, partial [Tremellales sp. Uapishka_1]
MDPERRSGGSDASIGAGYDDKKIISTNEYTAQILAMSPEEFAEADRKLLWKMDKNLVPWMTLLFVMSFMDRINIGTAKLAGITTQLHLTSLEFNTASMIFFVSYVAFEIPSNLVLKKFRPSRWIPLIMVVWAIFQTCMGLVQNYGQLLALRFCLGLAESGLFPGISFFLSGWYKRREAAKRIALFFAGAVLAGAFGGIFGYALSRMAGVGGKEGWSWIFIIEGLLSFVIGIASIWMVHDWPEQAKFLTPLEREMVLMRLKQDVGLASEGTFSWKMIRKAVTDWKTWCLMLMYVGCAEPIYAQSLFSPTIIASLGKFTTSQSLLLSTPPYVLAFITTMITAYLSDKTGKRGFFMMFWSAMAAIGYLLFLTVPFKNTGVLYFAVFLTTASIAPCIATTITWSANTFGNHYKKATAMGMVFSLGNSGGIISSQVYRAKDSPRYLPGHGTTFAFSCLCCICAVTLYFGMKRENKRRERIFGPAPAENEVQDVSSPEYLKRWGLEGMSREEIVELGDDHPAFRYIT